MVRPGPAGPRSTVPRVPAPDLHVTDSAPAQAEPAGEAPLVVVVHGAMDRASSFGRVARSLRELHVIRYDRRGYGRSIGAGIGTLDDHVADLLAVLDDRPACVFGHSIGGVIALVAAVARPELVRSVLAFEPPTPWAAWWPRRATPGTDSDAEVHAETDLAGAPAGGVDPAEEAEAFMRRAVGDRIWARLPARTREDRLAEGPALLADMASVTGPAPFHPASIAASVIVGCGAESSWWHRRAAEELAAELAHGALAVVGGAQHGAHLSHPSAVAALVCDATQAGFPDWRSAGSDEERR
jgi:pimeloyl-ACP methyl ester carboxylesterase